MWRRRKATPSTSSPSWISWNSENSKKSTNDNSNTSGSGTQHHNLRILPAAPRPSLAGPARAARHSPLGVRLWPHRQSDRAADVQGPAGPQARASPLSPAPPGAKAATAAPTTPSATQGEAAPTTAPGSPSPGGPSAEGGLRRAQGGHREGASGARISVALSTSAPRLRDRHRKGALDAVAGQFSK